MRPRSAGRSKDHLLNYVYQQLHHPTWHTLSWIEGSNGLPSVRARWRGYNESYLRGTFIYTYMKLCFAVISGSADRCARNGRRSRRPQRRIAMQQVQHQPRSVGTTRRRRCESTSMGITTFDLHPGRGFGPFTLGDRLLSTSPLVLLLLLVPPL